MAKRLLALFIGLFLLGKLGEDFIDKVIPINLQIILVIVLLIYSIGSLNKKPNIGRLFR